MAVFPRWFRLRTRATAGRRFRPTLEPLEARTLLTVYMVTTTADLLHDTTAGEVTLRDAITAIDTQAASGNAPAGTLGKNTIDFHIGATGSVETINLGSALPALGEPVLIDGWSQGGTHYAGPPLIVLNGSSAGGGANGLEFDAGSSGSIVRGLVIQAFSANGIEVRGSSSVHITGNYLGTDATGTDALGNGQDAILIDQGANGTVVGGTAPSAGNVICGSVLAPPGGVAGTQGAILSLAPASIAGTIASFTVTLNYTDAAAEQLVYVGIDVRASASSLAPPDATGTPDYSAFSFIPSSTLGDGWAAVANAFPGEFLYHAIPDSGAGLAPNATYVLGTLTYDLAKFNIAPDPALSIALTGSDTTTGVQVPGDPTTFTFVDPTFPSGTEPLVNAAPTTAGVEIAGSGTTGTQVIGNRIGTNPTGTTTVGHLADGVLIDHGATQTAVTGNTVGGNDTGIVITDPGTTGTTVQGNRIGTDPQGNNLANTVAGVVIENGATGNTVGGTTPASANTIADNGKGVVIGNSPTDTTTVHDTVTGNHIYNNVGAPIELGNHGSTPTGVYPNDSQSTPAIGALTLHSIAGSLTSVANTAFRIEVYANPVLAGLKPGQTFLGFLTVRTNAAGKASFVLPVASLPLGYVFTATATDLANGDTSSFSPVGVQAVVLGDPVLTANSAAQLATVRVQVLTATGPPTSGRLAVTISGLPGSVSVPLTGTSVVTARFPVRAGARAGSYPLLATVLGEDDVFETSAAGSLTIVATAGGGVSRRWTR